MRLTLERVSLKGLFWLGKLETKHTGSINLKKNKIKGSYIAAKTN